MGTTVAIGVFDGVHRGHQQLIADAISGGISDGPATDVVVLTFDPHPAAVLAPGREPCLLLTLADRREALLAAGASRVEVVPFTAELSQWSAQRFIDDVVMPLNPATVCVGSNFRFGRAASADADDLVGFGAERGFTVAVVPLAADGSAALSSSRARELISQGRVTEAAAILGRPHRVVGPVVHGDARGRELGFPTANVRVDAAYCVPADGVYAGRLTVLSSDRAFEAAVSVGTNPHFAGNERRVEAYVLDAPDRFDVYDEQVRVEFLERVRGQQVFDSIADLIAAMGRDVADVRRICAAAAG